MSPRRISSRNAQFQQWQAMLTNRTKRQRAGQFLVQGVRPITLAVEHGWPVTTLIHAADGRLSSWARDLLDRTDAERVDMDPELLAELGERESGPPELVAVVSMRSEDLSAVHIGAGFLGVVLDRPASPGNLGTIIRCADAFGADAVIVTGHAACPYDPKAVRASTGSLFALPVIRADSTTAVLDWVENRAMIVGTDEHGATPLDQHDFSGPTLLVIGTEATGMSAAWRDACHTTVTIPITGAASSLNAATAAAIALYEARRG